MSLIIKKASSFSTEEKAQMGITGIPANWPIESYLYVDTIPSGFELITSEDLQTLKENNQAAYDAWVQALRPIINMPPPSPRIVSIVENVPFAKPDYRTKRNATSSWVTCPANTTTTTDFQLTAEFYVSGGQILVKNVKEGDYISAEVYDVDEVVPAPYRSALCEAWPSVAKYIVKQWLLPTATDGYDKATVDTYPLNAKLTAGLYLRVSYHSTSESGDRAVAANYFLTKKLT